ncbi:MAG: acyl-CoA thioesterase [Rhodocyclaceae bacterium]|jgi:4-hydroxybenzoyl-CoA thioesterase|nr:acyl-CoA thioesterase [Rhodocyclaceae bacterium]
MKSEIPISMFEREVLIRFSHCDPGGIVFYPQYFVLMNGLVEDWFTEGLNINFADFVRYRRVGIPTVRMNCTFSRPSYIGDRLTLGLSVTKVGNSSFHLEVKGASNGELRLRAEQALVTICLDKMKSIDLPSDLREGFSRFSLALAQNS